MPSRVGVVGDCYICPPNSRKADSGRLARDPTPCASSAQLPVFKPCSSAPGSITLSRKPEIDPAKAMPLLTCLLAAQIVYAVFLLAVRFLAFCQQRGENPCWRPEVHCFQR